MTTFVKRTLALLALAVFALGSRGQTTPPIAFTVTVYGDPNVPTFAILNESREPITRVEVTVGKTDKSFDWACCFYIPGGSETLHTPDYVQDGARNATIAFDVSSFDPSETMYFDADVDNTGGNSGEDFRRVFFNNGGSINATVKAFTLSGSATLTLSNQPTSTEYSYTFKTETRPRNVVVKSLSDNDFVVGSQVRIIGNGIAIGNPIPVGNPETTVSVYDHETVEIFAPQAVYLDLKGRYLTDSGQSDSASLIQDSAQERFTAVGISVNEVSQLGDPTLYRFEVTRPATVVVKWRRDYALVVDSDFEQTLGLQDPVTKQFWAGPLVSRAAGNPEPSVKKTWVPKDTSPTIKIDSRVLDFTHPDLDVRYVVKGWVGAGAALNRNKDAIQRERTFGALTLETNQFTIRESTEQQQIPQFTMSGPASVKYVWQIQYGVRVNVDDRKRAALPRVFTVNGNVATEVGSGEGIFWFNPGVTLKVASPANVTPDFTSPALTGWTSGDGYYFGASGDINSDGGSLIGGFPQEVDGSPVARWEEEFTDSNGVRLRGMFIPQLERAARVLWTYGNQAFTENVFIGEHVFQHKPERARLFDTNPDVLRPVSITGANKILAPSEMVVWDDVAKRLYPLVPGTVKATWRSKDAPDRPIEVIINVFYPPASHYNHIANTPGVALDADPNDDFVFKGIKYTENTAAVDDKNNFTAGTPGKSVLLFGELDRSGRGPVHEFLRVRVVETKFYSTGLTEGSAIIGQKITAAEDLANFGTGFIYSFATQSTPDRQRYNPNIYDPAKLKGIASKDLYDLARLRSDTAEKVIRSKDKLPGPIIPVNLHPGASDQDRIVVVWYDDPAKNDGLLWPYRAVRYLPRWPEDASEGLGRIVIASQWGSESLTQDGSDQQVEPAVGDAPAETTFNPTRFQQLQVYSKADLTKVGYNPNEEHALIAPSLRFVSVSPRPSAAYALRNNDLNQYSSGSTTESGQPANYTSHPYVLVQFLDTADDEFKMRIYRVVDQDFKWPGHRFADQGLITPGSSGRVTTPTRTLFNEPHVTMEAGEPVIPFYPIGVVSGASPCNQSFGVNLLGQATYWEDHKNTSWAVSGGENAWFTHSSYYPLAPDFWWPGHQVGLVRDLEVNKQKKKKLSVPFVGDCVSFLPANLASFPVLAATEADRTIGTQEFAAFSSSVEPRRVLYKSDWPQIAPVLKSGETLSFSGGEYHADHPFSQIIDSDGALQDVETPGLPGIVGFAAAEVVFDSLNAESRIDQWRSSWTARVAPALERRSVPLSMAKFPGTLQPATKRTRVKNGKYVFNDLPASLQRRVRFDPTAGQLEIVGLLNDKEISDHTLTASPGAVYVLEPNIMTEAERVSLRNLADSNTDWTDAIDKLYKLSINPSLIAKPKGLPVAGTPTYVADLKEFWRKYYAGLSALSPRYPVPLPIAIGDALDGYYVGLQPLLLRDDQDFSITIPDPNPKLNGLPREVRDPQLAVPIRAFGPGLALIPNSGFLNPTAGYPDISWVTVAENNDPTLGGSPVVLHVIKVDRRERYRGAIKTLASDNVFDENLMLRHQGDFGAKADDLYFEWWYRPDDGGLNVPPPDLLKPSQANPWKLFPDPSGNQGRGRFQILLKGNPNAPETLLADSFWFCRYRHKNDVAQGSNWSVPQPDNSPRVNFTWAGAGNSDPFNDFDGDGVKDFRAQLAEGWIKRVLDAVNPYEARIRDFEGDNPSTRVSMLAQFGQRYEGPVALNPAKDVIENAGLIELYETILNRGKDLSIGLSRPVSTPAIANALQLASTRLADFYTILGNEAYTDSLDPTIGFGSDSVEYGVVAPAVYAFQNQMSSLLDEELALLRGVDDNFARPVYNRLFWNFTKGEGEAAYAVNYNISDVNQDGFVDEKDAAIMYPQGHGDAWGHYLTAVRLQYDLLRDANFNWVSRSESYNLQDVVISVDFLDERKFAQSAATKAKAGAEIVNLTYRDRYVDDPSAQWQGYTDSLADRAWGVQEWARRSGQGAYFDWITANALLPTEHPNKTLDGIRKVDRQTVSEISVVSANLNRIQSTFDQANKGQNPLGLAGNVVPFDIDPAQLSSKVSHFDQIYARAIKALENVSLMWDNANQFRNMIRKVGNSEMDFRNKTFQDDLTYRNKLIGIFGRPYEGTIGAGKVYPAGYNGPDLLLYMYVDVREINDQTVPGPTEAFAKFDATGNVTSGLLYDAFKGNTDIGGLGTPSQPNIQVFANLPLDMRQIFAPSFAPDISSNQWPIFGQVPAGKEPILVRSGSFSVNYTDLLHPKVPLNNLTQLMPVTAAGYSFQAPRDWGKRASVGDLQAQISKMLQQEASVASSIRSWESLASGAVRKLRQISAKRQTIEGIFDRNTGFSVTKAVVNDVIKALDTAKTVADAISETVKFPISAGKEAVPLNLPTGGLSVSPGDALSFARSGFVIGEGVVKDTTDWTKVALTIAKAVAEIGLDAVERVLAILKERAELEQTERELLKDIEDTFGDEAIKRIDIFKNIQSLRDQSDDYRSMVDEGTALVNERAAFNKRVAAQTQRARYQDMTFRVSQNHALQSYRAALDIGARYAYLAAKAYDYETNFDPSDLAAPTDIYRDIIRARNIGYFSGGDARLGKGGLADALARLKINFDALRGQLGVNNPQTENGKISLRGELFRILPKTNTAANALWTQTLQQARVDDLWNVSEFRYFCRPFASETDKNGIHVAQPGLILRFGSEITAGKNFFGKPLSGGDHAYDPSSYSMKLRAVGVSFGDYLSTDVATHLSETPRIYFFPVGTDIMRTPRSVNPNLVRLWNVLDQRIPIPIPATSSDLDNGNWIVALDSLNGRIGDPRQYSTMRAYHNDSQAIDGDSLVFDSRLVGRSVWNTQWVLIIPGALLKDDPNTALNTFISQVTDIKVAFQTYGYSGN